MLESLSYSQLARISLNFSQQRYAGEIFFLLQNGQLSLSAPFHLGSTPFRSPQKCGFQKRKEKNLLFHFREVLAAVSLFSEANVFAERERERVGLAFFSSSLPHKRKLSFSSLPKEKPEQKQDSPLSPTCNNLPYIPHRKWRKKKKLLSHPISKRKRGRECANIPFPHHYIPDLFPLFPTHPPKSFLFFRGGNIHPPPPHASGRPYLLYAGNGLSPYVFQLCRSMTSFFFFGRKCNSYFLFSLFSLSRSFPSLPFSSAISSRPLPPPADFPRPTPPGHGGQNKPKVKIIHQKVHIMLQKVGFFISLKETVQNLYFLRGKSVKSVFRPHPSALFLLPSLLLLSLRQKLLHDKGKIREEGEKRREG